MNQYYLEDYDNPGTELVTSAVNNPMASDVMRLAADYRSEGMNASEALKTAWRLVNGVGEDPTFEPSALLMVLATAGAFIGIWKLVKHVWPWQSWGLDRKQIMARPIQRISPQATAERQRYNVSPIPSDRTEERVTLITP